MARHIRALYPLKRTCSGQLPRWAYKGARALELLRQCRSEGMPIERVVVGDDQEGNLRVIREVLQAAYPGLPCVGYQTLAELAPPPSPLALSGVACSSVAPVPEAGCAKKGLPPGLGCFGSASASSPSPEVRYSRRGLRDQACGFFSPEPQMPAQRALPRGGSSSVTGMEGLSLG